MMTKEESTKIVNFYDPLDRGSCAGVFAFSDVNIRV